MLRVPFSPTIIITTFWENKLFISIKISSQRSCKSFQPDYEMDFYFYFQYICTHRINLSINSFLFNHTIFVETIEFPIENRIFTFCSLRLYVYFTAINKLKLERDCCCCRAYVTDILPPKAEIMITFYFMIIFNSRALTFYKIAFPRIFRSETVFNFPFWT